MNELELIASLLNNPGQLNLNEVSANWFEMDVAKSIVKAVSELNGQCTISEVVEAVNEHRDAFSKVGLDEIQMLASNDTGQNTKFSDALTTIHKNYLRAEIESTMQRWQTEHKQMYLNKIADLTAEMRDVRTAMDDGLLATSQREFERAVNATVSKSIKTYPTFDRFIGGGMREGQLITIGARSGVGKTLVAINLMVQALQLNDGLRADYFSLEMNKFEIVNRIISRAESINSLKLVDYTNLRVDEKQKVIAGYRKLASQYDMALFGEELSTLGAIKRKIKQRAVNGRYICFIDYIGLINVEGVRNGGDSAGRIKMNIITRELKLLASELKIPIVMIAQLNRGLEYRQDKTPTLADLKESGSIEQDSTIVLFISRDTDDPNKAILHVGKNRVGIVGSLPFYINPSFMEFREYDQQ